MDFHQASLYLLAVKISTHTTTDQRLLTAHANLTERVTPIYEDARSYFTARLFISHISAFKIFLQKIVALVIQKHPKKVGSIEFRLSDILDASSNAELVQRATDEFLNRIMYKKPHEYLSDLCGLLSINKAFLNLGGRFFLKRKHEETWVSTTPGFATRLITEKWQRLVQVQRSRLANQPFQTMHYMCNRCLTLC